MDVLKLIGTALLVAGGVAWGYLGLFELDVVALFFGRDGVAPTLVALSFGQAAVVRVASYQRPTRSNPIRVVRRPR